MSDVEKRKGLFQGLFGAKSSRCCSMEFEEDPVSNAKPEQGSAVATAEQPIKEADSGDDAEGTDENVAATRSWSPPSQAGEETA